MKCDHHMGMIIGCLRPPVYAPELSIPSSFVPLSAGFMRDRLYRPVRLLLRLHYCEQHMDSLKIETVLTPDVKRRLEDHAKRSRASDFRIDFERGFIQFVKIDSLEYRRFCATLDAKKRLVN